MMRRVIQVAPVAAEWAALPLGASLVPAGPQVPQVAASTCVPGSSPAPWSPADARTDYHTFGSQTPAFQRPRTLKPPHGFFVPGRPHHYLLCGAGNYDHRG